VTRFDLITSRREELVDITSRVVEAVRAEGVATGLVNVHCPHTTAGIAVNEHADPDVARDLLDGLARLAAPLAAGWRHAEGNSDAHVKASLVGTGVTLPISGGSVVLGTWQGVFFCEFDGPRSRHVLITVVAS
jgi:secondary thiamine-phosphate synthase enzyme